jgi:acyl carrier protein
MPVTQNGKIDHNALRQMTIAASSFQSGVLEGLPGNDMERIVADHLCNALGLQAMGLHDNFFDLGAHSLTIAEMRASLATALGRDISIVDLYEYPTVSSLSRHLAGHIAESSTSQVTARAQRRKLARNQ